MNERRSPYGQMVVLLAAFGVLLIILILGQPKPRNLIAFVSNRDGSKEIYVMNFDGSNQRQLTCNHNVISGPMWLPDGQRLAFVSLRNHESTEIYLVTLADALQTPLESDNAVESCEDNSLRLTWTTVHDALDPAWSPDGQKIAFKSSDNYGTRIYVMNWDGSEQRILLDSNMAASDFEWSPDGQHIAFVTGRDGNAEIYIVDSDGENPRRITNNDVRDFLPMWSPDSRYVLVSGRGRNEGGPFDLYLMNADGSNRQYLSQRYGSGYESDNRSSLWSPDSRFIVFDERRQGYRGIFTIEVATGNRLQLTQLCAEDTDPAWSPDGKQITFVSNRDRNWEIYVMNADGSNQRRLTWNDGEDVSPAWMP